MKLIAQKPLRYAGVSLNVGDEFEASVKDAGLLKVIGKAKDAPENVANVAPVVSVVAPDDKPRRGRPKKVDITEDDEDATED